MKRAESDVKLLDKGGPPFAQADAEPEDNAKLASVTADQRKLLLTEYLKKLNQEGLMKDGDAHTKALAFIMEDHDGRRRKESGEQLRDQSQYQYVDEKLPLPSAAFTSLAWQAIFSKFPAQVILVLGWGLTFLYNVYFLWLEIYQGCPGFDGDPNPQYFAGHWGIWQMRVPCFPAGAYGAASVIYLAWFRGHHGRVLLHGFQIPFGVIGPWWVFATTVLLLINPQNQEEIERTCWVARLNTSETLAENAAQIQQENLQILLFGMIITLFVCGPFGGKRTVFPILILSMAACCGAAVLYKHYVFHLVAWSFFTFLTLLLLLYIILGRRYLMHTTALGIKEDSDKYVHAINNIMPLKDSREVLALADQVKAVKDATPERVKRHHGNVKYNKGDILQIKDGQPWTDRFDLFDAAFNINGGFQQRAGEWAAKGQGEHHWAPVKGVYRVYQKVKRAYGGRMHRVCDIVRTTITFKDLRGLMTALKAIEDDPDVHILRVKNRYDPEYESLDCYRDVALLVVGQKVTGGFVSEVQLNLESMYEAKSGGGHKRYIFMRDARGD